MHFGCNCIEIITGPPKLCIFFSGNYVLFFGELCARNPELCSNYVNCTILHNIFKFQVILLLIFLCFKSSLVLLLI